MTREETTESPSRHYQILVFGIEKRGLTAPKDPVRTRNFTLNFEAFNTSKRFNEFDAVVLFQGIFEQFERKHNYLSSHLVHDCLADDLDKRKKESDLLLNKGGVLCFLLSDRFIDHDDHRDFRDTDLAKHYLNYSSFYRDNFASRVTKLNVESDDFRRFLNVYGASNSHFQHHNESLETNLIATASGYMVGMVLHKLLYFIPALVPDNRPEVILEYFTLLGDGLISSHLKLRQELPQWIEAFEFQEENALKKRLANLTAEIESVNSTMDKFRSYKRILALSGGELVSSVADVFTNVFGIKVNSNDDYREDLKLLDDEGKPFLLCEVKGTNGSVKREHVNQTDSHRERSGYDSRFPTLLIANTNMKSSRSLVEKDQPIPLEQVIHAKKLGVLILRSLDLLCLAGKFMENQLARQEIIELLTENVGWLRVNDQNITVYSGEEKSK